MKKIINLVCCGLSLSLLTGCGPSKTVTTYDITFCDDLNNVLEVVKVKEGEVPAYSKGTPTKEDTESTIYTFDRWLPEIKPATENATYVASFSSELRKYTVTFDSDGGTEIAPVTVEWGKRISGVSNPTKADSENHTYTFEYWYDITGSDSTRFSLSTEIKRDYNLRAKWAEALKTYTVTFNSNGGSLVSSQNVEAGNTVTKPTDPTHEDSVSNCYTFGGWYTSSNFSGEPFDFSTAITSDLTLYAKWNESPRQYTVNFYSGDDVFYTTQVDYKGKVTPPTSNPTKADDEVGQYTFNHWDFDFEMEIVGNVDIYAVYDINYIYYHYTSLDSTCTQHGCKEFYETKDGTYTLEAPTQYYRIEEAGAVTSEIVNRITSNNENDERLLPLAHEFDDVSGKCIYECGTQSITSSAVDSSKLSRTSEYTCPLEYGNMYKYDGYARDIFTSYPLEGLTEIRFYVANPDAGQTFILNGNASNCSGGIYGGPSTFDGIIATKSGDDWTVSRSSGKNFFGLYNGSFVDGGASYTVSNPTTINEIFDTYTYASVMYISDIIVEGTLSEQKEVLSDAYFVGTNGTKTYSLTNTGEKITGYGNKYEYRCLYGETTTETAFRDLFNEIDISNFKTVSFYIDINKDNYLTFADDEGSDASTSSAYGLHGKDGAHVPGIIKAYNEGNGTWRVTAIGMQFRKISDASKATEYTVHNRTTLKSLFTIGTSNSWQKAMMYVSDVVVSK